VKKKVLSYSVTRRVPIADCSDITISTLQDGYMCIHAPDHDAVIECDHKTELIMLMREHYKNATGRDLPVYFKDTIPYVAKTGEKQKQIQLFKDEAAIPLIQQQEATKNKIKSFFSSSAIIRIGIPSGLPKDTDTTPRGWNNTFAGASGAPAPRAAARGGNRAANNAIARLGGGGMYDMSYQQEEEEEAPAPAPVARPGPARGGGGGGRALPAAGGPARGGPARGGPARGGPARGGAAPARGGPARGGPARGGAAPARGGPARGAPAGGGGGRALPAAGGPSRGGPARGGAGPARGGPARGGPARGGGAPQQRAMPAPPRAPPTPARPKATAAYDYTAQSPDELSFAAGDVITILKKDESGWWEGELHGQKGWIPANYMEE